MKEWKGDIFVSNYINDGYDRFFDKDNILNSFYF